MASDLFLFSLNFDFKFRRSIIHRYYYSMMSCTTNGIGIHAATQRSNIKHAQGNQCLPAARSAPISREKFQRRTKETTAVLRHMRNV